MTEDMRDRLWWRRGAPVAKGTQSSMTASIAPPTSARRITLERIEAAARAIDPVFLHTPQWVCEPLG